jgi:type I restriction enzyme M protein
MGFERASKNIDDILHKNADCTSELNYTEQSSWLLFLKYLDALKLDKATEAALQKKNYTHIIDEKFRRSTRAAPRGANGKVDRNRAATGADLIDLANQKLIPYMRSFS